MYFHDRFLKTLVTVLLFCLAPAIAQSTALQTINSLEVFSSQKPCAQACFSANNGYNCQEDVLASVIGCQNSCNTNAPNYCYCRTDLQSVAESYLTSCVRSACTVGDSSIDISSAGSIYSYYCSSIGFPAPVPATTTRDSAAATTTPDSAAATTTQDGAAATTTQDGAAATTTAYVTVYSSNGAPSAGLAYSTVANICVLFSLISVHIFDVS
jgi:hypothetical protein